MIDPFAPYGLLNYWKGLHLKGLPDEAIDAYIANARRASRRPRRRSSSATAARWPGSTTARAPSAIATRPTCTTRSGRGPSTAQTDAHLEWVFSASEAMEPFTTGGVYLNFTAEREDEAVRAGYGDDAGWAKLVAVKDECGPGRRVPVQPQHQAELRLGRPAGGAAGPRATSRPRFVASRRSGYTAPLQGRLAELGEHQLDKLGVTGSSPGTAQAREPGGSGAFASPDAQHMMLMSEPGPRDRPKQHCSDRGQDPPSRAKRVEVVGSSPRPRRRSRSRGCRSGTDAGTCRLVYPAGRM